MSATVIAQAQGPSERSRDFSNTPFQSLPGTLAEGESIDKELKYSRLLKAEQATETALKQSVTPHILHMATHGFFLADQPLTPGTDSTNTRYQYENPLLRAGLAFVGANHLPQAPDDGILTALEVSGLNLRGTQMVVMSACQTGLGEIISGEGVYGLRRAFTLAGSRSQLMSLWRVRDVSTKDLMVAYYQRLKSGQPRGKALQAVQQQMLKGEMKDSEGKTYTHPYYWAAFVRTGDWSPMNLE
ncbi:CHAT domain-containing protein [Acaryochloris sp. IP29b_bin.137]|uniref:CHAT domain-containing protein n=1 Tax=Acaryochloris sp. IP29b_bin.137 TaxID=2969217 RepID=UPI002613EEB1|nr:CHAT domain-containing protein [Acaryochloris sp. IP29b_bin.137]